MKMNYKDLQEIELACKQCTILEDDPDNIDACDTCNHHIDHREYEIYCPDCGNDMSFAPDENKESSAFVCFVCGYNKKED